MLDSVAQGITRELRRVATGGGDHVVRTGPVAAGASLGRPVRSWARRGITPILEASPRFVRDSPSRSVEPDSPETDSFHRARAVTRARDHEGRLTIEEYARLDEPDEFRTELVRGRLVREPRPGTPHGYCQALLTRHLVDFVAERDLGVVLTDVGVVIDGVAETVRGPDLVFVSYERLSGPLPDGFLEVAPDLAVEIVSPGNTASGIQEKVLEYLDAGAGMVWVVDPGSRTATTYRSRHDAEILSEDEDLEGGEVLPGLRLSLKSVLPE